MYPYTPKDNKKEACGLVRNGKGHIVGYVVQDKVKKAVFHDADVKKHNKEDKTATKKVKKFKE